MKRYCQFAFLLLLCAPALAHATDRDSATQRATEPLPKLAFDKKGKLTNKEDLDRICRQLAMKPQTVVVFMHGWHGSAAPNDHSVVSFQNALAEVRRRSFQKSGRTLTGILLTWHAEYLPGLADYPMYYFSQGRANAVARGDGIVTAIARLSKAVDRGNREHFIVAGHSLGGRILGHVAGYHPELLRNVDLWLLANAADNAKVCQHTIDEVNNHPYRRGRLPKLVWVTSIQDWATGFAYRLANLSKAPGWEKKLRSHEVRIYKPTPTHPTYSADVDKVSDATGAYAHNLIVLKGLGNHGDVWSEPMIQVVDYYVLHQ